MRHIFRSARVLQAFILAALLLASPAWADDVQTMPVVPDIPHAGEVENTATVIPAEPPDPGPAVILPDTLKWTPLPDSPESSQVWLHGDATAHGPTLLRVRLAAGGRVGVRAHPDERIFSVLAGTLSVGFGSIFDETRMHDIPAGAVFIAPADQPHYLWARDGDAEYQVGGGGLPDIRTP